MVKKSDKGVVAKPPKSKKPRGPAFHNIGPNIDLPPNASAEAAKAYVSRQLQLFMDKKGWRQIELARHAELQMPKGKRFGRDSVCGYIRGKNLPGPLHLNAMAAALGVKPADILPRSGIPAVGEHAPAFDVRSVSDGNVWLRVNQAVPVAAATEIIAILSKQGVAR